MSRIIRPNHVGDGPPDHALSVRQEGSKVILIYQGRALLPPMPFEVARLAGLALQAKAKAAEEHHWQECESRLGSRVPLKRVLGMPVLDDVEQIERLG